MCDSAELSIILVLLESLVLNNLTGSSKLFARGNCGKKKKNFCHCKTSITF